MRESLNKSQAKIENVGMYIAEKIQPIIASKAEEERRPRPVSQVSSSAGKELKLKICKLGKLCDRKKCKDLHIAPAGKAPVFIPGGSPNPYHSTAKGIP